MADEKIVSAVGTAIHSEVPGLAEALEDAMTKAVMKYLAAGGSIEDSETIIAIKAFARETVMEEWRG